MKFELGELIYRITGDNTGINKDLQNTEKAAKKTGKSFKEAATKLKLVATAAAVGLGLFFKKAFNDAKQAQEINQKFAVTFREVSKEAKAAASNLSDSFGLAKTEAKELLANTGDLLSGFGFTGAEALSLSDRINILAVDLASFSNIEGGTTRASEALTKAMLGERESAKALGLVISEAAVKEELRRLGLEKSTGDALLRAKAEATYNIAVRQSTNAIGDFNRSQDSTANVQRRLEAQAKDLRIEVGKELTPAFTELGVMFLETSKDGGIIQKALIAIAKATAFATRTLNAYLEGLNLASAVGDLEGIEERRVANAKKLVQINKELNAFGFKRIDQLSKTNIDQSALLLRYNAAKSTQEEINDLLSKNQKQIIGSADRQDDLVAKLKGEKDELAEIIDKREKGKNLAKDTAKSTEKIKKDTKETAEELSKLETFQNNFNVVADSSLSLLGAIVTLLNAQTESRLNDLDIQEQRALEVAGVEEDTAVEKAEKELALAKEAGDQELIIEKQNAVEREKILEDFDKKRAKAEYEGALASWELQRAQAAIQALQAPLNAYTSTLAIPGVGVLLAGGAAVAAGIAAGVLLAAVNEAKPPAPRFEGGGIVPGSSYSGDKVAAQVNSGELVLNQAQQAQLFSLANGGGSGGQFQRVAPLSKEMMYDDLFEASQNGELFFSKKGVV